MMSTKKPDECAVRKSPRLRTRSSKAVDALATRDLSFRTSSSSLSSTMSRETEKQKRDVEEKPQSSGHVSQLRKVFETRSRKRKLDDSLDTKVVEEEKSPFNLEDKNNDIAIDVSESKETLKRHRGRSTMLEKLQPSKGFVDKTDVGAAPEDTIPMRRRPRMASLNAIAKVNAVLDCYTIGPRAHTDAKKTDGETKDRVTSKTVAKRRTSSSSSTVAHAGADVGAPPEIEPLCLVAVVANEDQPISDSQVSSTSRWLPEIIISDERVMIDKAVQTESNDKAVQTEVVGSLSKCTCHNRFLPVDNTKETIVAVPVSSLIQTKTNTHKLYIPFTKQHLLSHTSLKDVKKLPQDVLQVKGSKVMESLHDIAVNNAIVILQKPYASLKGTHGKSFYSYKRHRDNRSVHLKIPKVNFAATSTSTFSAFPKSKIFHPVKAISMRKFSSSKDANQRDVTGKWTAKMVNGWVFGGDPVEKTFAYDDLVVTRRYYTCMRRSNEVINIRDSVLLKSGTRKKDLPYVARVSAIWEEDEGPNAGDMMVSVFWYYRPEQTEIDKVPGFHGEMEVLASKHRDDNSVACIVDKCYVLSYPQFCRFRAKSCLYRESRKTPSSLVPPSESTRPGSMPPPNIDPSLVFFGRQVYDYRSGRILKSIV